MPKVYTWPNDPQVYGGDSPVYRVIFAPGGNPSNAPITELGTIPFCQDLPGKEKVYGLSNALTNCSNVINYGALYAQAVPKPANWPCDVDPTDSGDNAVICKWKSPAQVKQIGLRANFNSGGSNLQLSVLPQSLLKEGDLLLASITFNTSATPTLPSGWTQVPGASVASNSNDQTVVWYHFVGEQAEPASYTWTWNAIADPSGGITAWRGVDSTVPFDTTASVNEGVSATATAPSITTHTAFAQVLSVFGAGNTNGQAFALPSGGPGIGTDETGALKVNVAPSSGTYYAHLVADRIEAEPVATATQSVPMTSSSDWTAISLALKPK
jgi:hypothetical protein